MFCENCGNKLKNNDKFCDACGSQTVKEQEIIQDEKKKNYDANVDKTMGSSISITIAMIIFSLIFVIFVGFDEGEARVATITAIAFSIFICGLKWYYEMKNQRKWKKEIKEKAKGSD